MTYRTDHFIGLIAIILVQRRMRETVGPLVRKFAPAVIGLSVMTFQSARRCASLNSSVL
jgi:hypothetical protein